MATLNIISPIPFSIISIACTVILLAYIEGVVVAGATQKALFVFGDSLFDAGNNQYYTPTRYSPTNHYPYGLTYFETATGRFSDGLIVPDYIAQYANMPFIPPALDHTANGTYGYNFASGGSGVLYHADFMNLRDQLVLFENLTSTVAQQIGEEEYKIVLQKSLYLFSTGGNDYLTYCTYHKNATEEEIQGFVDVVIQGIIEGIKEIYLKGGRKFAFQDVGPIGCMPMTKYSMGQIDGCYEPANYIATKHNIALRSTFQNMTDSEEFEDIKFGVFDYYHQLTYRFNNATKYGFEEGEIACCGYGGKINADTCGKSPYFLCSNPSAFVLFDGAHHTQKTNSQMAKLMWSGDQTIIAPYNVKQLFGDDEDEENNFSREFNNVIWS